MRDGRGDGHAFGLPIAAELSRGLALDASVLCELEGLSYNIAMITIADVAKLTGLTPRMIRNYGAIGLVREPERSAARYRLYYDDDVERLRLIAAARDCGLSMEETRDVVALAFAAPGPGDVHGRLRPLLKALDDRERGLRLVRLALEKAAADAVPATAR